MSLRRPALKLLGLALRQIRLHRKLGLRQIDGVLVVSHGHSSITPGMRRQTRILDQCASAARARRRRDASAPPAPRANQSAARRAAAPRTRLRARARRVRPENRTDAPRAAAARHSTVGRVPRLTTAPAARHGLVAAAGAAHAAAKIPASGVRRRSTRRLAVGNPSVAPEPRAAMHARAHRVGTAEQLRGARQSPAASAVRTRPLLTRTPSSVTGATISTSKPKRFRASSAHRRSPRPCGRSGSRDRRPRAAPSPRSQQLREGLGATGSQALAEAQQVHR